MFILGGHGSDWGETVATRVQAYDFATDTMSTVTNSTGSHLSSSDLFGTDDSIFGCAFATRDERSIVWLAGKLNKMVVKIDVQTG